MNRQISTNRWIWTSPCLGNSFWAFIMVVIKAIGLHT